MFKGEKMKHLQKIATEFVKMAATYPKWWSRLTYDEQKEYIHDHPGTDLRATAPRLDPITGQEPIAATHYSVKGRLTNERGELVGGVIRETINVSDNRFSGAKTLQDLVDKIQQSQPKFKVLKIRPKQKVKEHPVNNTTSISSDEKANALSQEMYGQNFDSVNMTNLQKRRVKRQLENEQLGVTVEKGKVKPKPVISDKPLVVGNIAQKILFLCEMQGQISDGQWENARGDHWKVWSDLDWDKVGVGDNIGRKFYAQRDGYNFTNPELLDVVGDRMLYTVNLYKKYPKIVEPILTKDHHLLPESYEDAKTVYEGRHIRNQNDPNDYWAQKRKKLIDAGLTLDMFKDAEENPVYTEKEMKNDLRGLKKAFKPESDNQKAFKCTFDVKDRDGSLAFRSLTVKANDAEDAIKKLKTINNNVKMYNIREFEE